MGRIILPHGARDPEAWHPDSMFNAVVAFDRMLRARCGIDLAAGRRISEVMSHLLNLLSAFKREIPEDQTRDLREEARVAVGIADLAQKAEHVSEHADFVQLCHHFRLLLEDSRIIQNDRSTVLDSASNKIFELLIALCVMQFGRSILLDDPKSSRGDNPDILALVRGAQWGFACKVSHSSNLQTYADAVRKGISQIERSTAQRGVVMVSMKNVLKHEQLLQAFMHEEGTYRYGAFPSAVEAFAVVEKLVEMFLADWEDAFGGEQGLEELFSGKKASRAVFNVVHTTTFVIRNERPVLTTLRFIVPLLLDNRLDSETAAVCEMLDDAVQTP